MKLSREHMQLLKEYAAMDFKELNAMRQQCIRYFGSWSEEVKLINQELKRRKALKPGIKLAMENIKLLKRQCKAEIKRLESLTFASLEIYDAVTLDRLTAKSKHKGSVLTGKLAYRVAHERINVLELTLLQFEQHLDILNDGNRVTAITMDIIEAYNIDLNKYRNDLYERLRQLKAKCFPGTTRHLPTMYRHAVPTPVEHAGPRIGDWMECGPNKNFRPGSYLIVMGGVGWNRYYCRKLLERMRPEPGHRLFVVSYSNGIGHYILSVPEKSCYRRTLKYSEFARGSSGIGYYERRRKRFAELDQP